MAGVELFFGSGEPSWAISSPLILYPEDPFGVDDNNLVTIAASNYDFCYGDLPDLLNSILVVFIVIILATGAAILVPLFCTFGKRACYCQSLMELKDEIALLKYSKKLIRACRYCVAALLVVLLAVWMVWDKTFMDHSTEWLALRVCSMQHTVHSCTQHATTPLA